VFPGSPGRAWKEKDQPNLLKDEDVLRIANKHSVTAGQVLIRYQIDKGDHECVLLSGIGQLAQISKISKHHPIIDRVL
jgi:diketogulonate reductase-like aldo/keto reductase